MSKTILINSEFLGRGNDELGDKLMRAFLRALLTAENRPDKLVFYNSAVRLLAEGSPVLDTLNELNRNGVLLVACGTCVGYYNLDDKIARERVSNMQEIVKILMDSQNVVTV
jgi:selenium metabolism protein YedF